MVAQNGEIYSLVYNSKMNNNITNLFNKLNNYKDETCALAQEFYFNNLQNANCAISQTLAQRVVFL